MGEELTLKIQENAKLHAALDEVDDKYHAQISALESKVQSLEHQLSKQNKKDRADDSKQKELIHGLKFDNAELVSKVTDLEKELVDANDKITVLKVQLESSATSMSASNVSNPSLPAKLPSRISHEQLMPINTTEARIQTVEVLSTLGECVQNFVASTSDVHTYWEHRLKDSKPGSKLTDQSFQLSQLLLQNVKFLRPIEQSYQEMLSNILSNPKGNKFGFAILADFAGFLLTLKKYVDYTQDIEPLLVSCLQQENNASSCPPTQQARNGQLMSALKAYDMCLINLYEQMETLIHSKSNIEALENVENLTVIVSQLNQKASDICSIYSAKAENEAQLPTVGEALKDTNSCIVSALASLRDGTSILSHHLSDNLPKIGRLLTSEFIQDEHSPSSESEASPKEESSNELINEGNEDEDNDKEALANLKLITDGLKDKLKNVEQAKEHWKLECQLLQMKLEKFKNNDEDNEKPIEDHVKKTIDDLVSDRLLADSKAAHFYLEGVSLQKKIKYYEKCRRNAMKKLETAEKSINDLKEEARTTSVNYEEQLSMMSEHLANMNDKLTTQTDEIERLHFEMGNNKKVNK